MYVWKLVVHVGLAAWIEGVRCHVVGPQYLGCSFSCRNVFVQVLYPMCLSTVILIQWTDSITWISCLLYLVSTVESTSHVLHMCPCVLWFHICLLQHELSFVDTFTNLWLLFAKDHNLIRCGWLIHYLLHDMGKIECCHFTSWLRE